ncbi:toll-like receptor 4 [Strongylocentrotus purpuratus]|uniref:Uncharacterized protein n=1 Tax=Strongylocentrotus purpuratus TaxID=7668 RepID=A0A7M7N773_STRPU|nr:toll-like receptor 4 [Strongylocentrotus purpuratus]
MENTSQLHFDYFTIEATEIDGKSLETGTETRRGQEVYNIPFHHRAIVASVLIGLTLIGLLGNILVIIAVVVAKKLRTITNILVVNLAFADLVTCLCIPFQVVGLLSQTEGYPLHDFVCATVAGVAVTCICCSSSTLVVIAIVRWYVITKFVRGQRGIHSPKKLATVVAIIWIGSAALTVVPTLLGMGTLGYSQYYSLSTSINRLIPGTSVFTLYSIVLLPANSAVSPIIYGFKHPNFQLDLADCRIQELGSGIFRNLTLLTYLSLAENFIKIIPEKAFQDLQNLRTLKLNFNSITVIEKELFSRIPSLKYLSLQNNQISTIDPFTLIPTSLNVLIIANNPFTCTCQLEWFRELLDKMNTTIYQRSETRCSSTSFKSLKNQTIWSFHPKDYCGVNIYLIIGVSLAIVTVLSLSVLVYLKRWWLNHKLFLLKLAIFGYQEIIENQGHVDYEYQLNLMFREDDEWWINDCMKPFLQGRMPHLEHIVWGDSGLHPGSFYLNAIYDVIENSFKTVLLLSNQSVEDTWFMTKLRMAVEHMNDTKLEKVILIFLEDIDDDHLPYLVRLLLSRNKPYLLWVDDDEDGQELFWAQFQKSMRANRKMNNVIPV